MAKKSDNAGPDMERGLPTNVDAERYVLGSIMLDDTLFVQASASLVSDDFSLQKHRIIFRRMCDLHDRGERIDSVTVANELMKFHELEACDGLTYLTSLDDGLPQNPKVDSYILIVKEKSRLRRVIFTSQNMMTRAFLGEEEAADIITAGREQLMSVDSSIDRGDGPQTPGEIIESLPGGMNEFLSPPPRGLQTGFVKYDEMTGGLYNGDLIILAARPSVGKTALALNIAHYVAVKQRKKVVFFSLEMSKKLLLYRMVCAAARVDSQRVRLGYTTPEERKRLALAAHELAASKLYIDDKSAATSNDLHARIRKLMGEDGVDLCLVDYLQLMSAGRSYENKNQEVTAISRGLKLLAHELRLPMVVLSQLSRAVEARKGDHRPQLSDLRESGSIEQDADVVGFIFREEMYNRDREDLRGRAEVIIAKQRQGPVGTVHLVYLHTLTKFENRAEDSGDDDSSNATATLWEQ